MTVCRDLTVKEKEVEVKKKPIEFLYFLGQKEYRDVSTRPREWTFIDKLAELDYGRCLMVSYNEKEADEGSKNFYIGYWNDGVVE